ncbi:MAG TPA: helix-turn-helix domain-containing GNAT family N-acetyltransferase, partial [Azospira sp.]|nr:helix-turn-helix domain-containing GNAT family N-acetyltransferase [Azospira sp.]
MTADPSLVDDIRAHSRAMVRELGFMRPTLAATAYSASAVHALLEISARGAMTAAQLVQCLDLEKSSVSRMVARLVKAGELGEAASGADGRIKELSLTARGRRTVAGIHAYGQQQVRGALARLDPAQQQAVASGLGAYARALQACRLGTEIESAPGAITISAGYRPGLIGRVVEMHALFYARHAGFGAFFEGRVASGLAEFVGRLEAPCNGIWVALQHGRIVGSIAIDGQDLGNNRAHLRWFILDDGCRGQGAGRQLLQAALDFCDAQGFAATRLWTFQGLEAARRLYEASGFALVHEEPGQQWGSTVTEQQFTRPLGAKPAGAI